MQVPGVTEQNKTDETEHLADQTHSENGILQASWEIATPNRPVAAMQATVITQPLAKQRDDAPSPVIVVGCLVGFSLLSIALFFSSLPHYWFHRNQFSQRMKSSRSRG